MTSWNLEIKIHIETLWSLNSMLSSTRTEGGEGVYLGFPFASHAQYHRQAQALGNSEAWV